MLRYCKQKSEHRNEFLPDIITSVIRYLRNKSADLEEKVKERRADEAVQFEEAGYTDLEPVERIEVNC